MARKSRKALAEVAPSQEKEEGASEVADTPAKPRARRTRAKPPAEAGNTDHVDATVVDNAGVDSELSVTPKRRPTRSSRKRKTVDNAVEDGSVAGEESDLTPLEDDDKSPKKKPRKPRKPREPKPEPVYTIPDVQTLPTTFKGRLGYACLNTILRNKKPAKDAVFCSRTCRIATMQEHGIEFAKDLGLKNARDLLALVEWNEENNIRFMRVSSEMFPFASHKVWGYSLEYARAELEAVGKKAKEYGHRLTTHPGQFTQLGSPRDEVTENAIRDLEYHCDLLDMIGLGVDSVMIIHGGGTYGDKEAALVRLKDSIANRLPARVRARLVLENDEMCFSAEDLLPLCEELDIPLVFDYHHDWILPSSIPPKEIIARANAIFERRGIRPKQHLSSPRPGAVTVMEKRAHANRCETLPPDLPDDVDLMIEAKDKEQAVLHLYRIYQLQPVIHKSLRPPAENETLATNGRKSPKKRKRKGTDDSDDEAGEVAAGADGEEVAAGDEDLSNPELADVQALAEHGMAEAQAVQEAVAAAAAAAVAAAAATPDRTPRKKRKTKTE